MKRKTKLIICVIALSLLLSSCSQTSKRINDLTIVQALGIDSAQSETEVNIQYLNLSSGSGGTQQLQGNITSITKGKGENISSAVFSASKTVSNEIFLGQNKLIVFGAEFAQSNIEDGIEYLLKSAEARPDVPVAIGIPDSSAILKSKEAGAKIPAENVYSLIRLGEESGHCPEVTVCDLLNLYNDETSDIFLPVLSCEKDNVKCEGCAVFSENKYSALLNEEETFAFLTVKNRFESGIITFDSPGLGKISLRTTSSDAKKRIKIKDGKIIFEIRVKTKIKINETGKTIKQPLTDSDCVLLKKEYEKHLESLCAKTIEKCFENKSDPFMTARYLYFTDLDLYNSLKGNWRESLKNVSVVIKADSELQRVGNNTVQ